MESDNPRIKALNLLKLSSIAYLEAQNHGEIESVAAASEILREYNSTMVSRKPQALDTSSFTPLSGLNNIDIHEFFKDLPKFKDCRTNNITDSDVRALVSSAVKLETSDAQRGNNKRESDETPRFTDTAHNYRSVPNFPGTPVINLEHFKPCNQETFSPPSKIFASSSSEKPATVPLHKEPEESLFKKLEKQFLESKRDRKSASSETVHGHSAPFTSVPTRLQSPSLYQPRFTAPPSSAAMYEPAIPRQTTEEPPKSLWPDFASASNELKVQHIKKYGSSLGPRPMVQQRVGLSRNVASSFKPPFLPSEPTNPGKSLATDHENPLLRGIDAKLLEIIENEVVVNAKEVTWDDIAGLDAAKDIIQEAVILPLLRPDLFQGLRSIPKGILLFGPPGTGKTLIGKCIASQSDAKFLSISASTLTSKWVGEGEKLVRALFAYARVHQPSVIFLDEIDSILKKRSDTEHESSRRLKTEFLIQFEGTNTIQENDRVLLVGATNLPQELDDAARRRFTKRLYIPLPEKEGRRQLLVRLLEKNANSLTGQDFIDIAAATNGYSGADIKTLCADASMICLRELSKCQLKNVDVNSLRPINVDDFRLSLKRVKATVSQSELQQYIDWNSNFGSTT